MKKTQVEISWDWPAPFVYETKVEPQHIDDFQHTNNVVYLTWMAKAAWEHSKALGLDFDRYAALNRGMVVRRHELEYLAASRQGDPVLIGTWITANDGRLRLRRRFQMVNGETGETLLRGLTDFVCINVKTGRATRMPAEFVTTYSLTAHVENDI
ncbi:thioesterase family protein [Parvibaculum sp.]|jgi:acyl-CoA thioester hydrolase|uniref:acyl-CoA thioesterase n=1 Tax=Parvibaculum sp. TaxID=2024848 RepID=UPI000C50D05C|nr:thioesterase family protein [Parvibaculum sp.]MAM95922.1 thioesterase [Parvibaculum sp.]HCX69442.1 acyl-CoA thioesterase [Rhodobiaceae bacterium]|tara:strand:- start:9507 stop:9971 length:465 start_codon:yes stop_codon:yes gene_type:complete